MAIRQRARTCGATLLAAFVTRITSAFLEYAQARGFHIDPARVRHPRDKGRVERAVQTVRDDCFAGEILTTLEEARTHAVHWCREDYGLRRHSRTSQASMARVVFQAQRDLAQAREASLRSVFDYRTSCADIDAVQVIPPSRK